MAIRDMVESGVRLQGRIQVTRFDIEKESLDVLYDEETGDHVFLTTENEDFIDNEILYIYSDDGMIVIEVA